MADEFKTLLKDFSTLGTNYCQNAKKVTSDLEARKILDIYEVGLSGAMNGVSQMLTVQFDGLPEATRKEVDTYVGTMGVLPMLSMANETIGPNSLRTVDAVSAAMELFPKIKSIIRSVLNIEKGSWTDKGLEWIDTIIENIPKLLNFIR